MRWKAPVIGETRIKSDFLFFPKEICGETRWLEFAYWKQMYCPRITMFRNPYWKDVSWEDSGQC